MAAKKTKKMVTGIFRDRLDAETVFDYLHGMGYNSTEINVLMSDKTRLTYYPETVEAKHKASSKATEGMGVGGAIGTAVGATLAAVAAIGTSIAIPGLGLIVAGPLAAAFAGGGAGALTGGLLGGLIGAGMTEQNAQAYEDALQKGGVVIGVVPRNSKDANVIQKYFEEHNGESVCYC